VQAQRRIDFSQAPRFVGYLTYGRSYGTLSRAAIFVSERMQDDITMTEYQALGEVRYQIRRFLHFSEQMARGAGLEPQQHQLLLALKSLPGDQGATVSTLAERLQIQHHSAVELINRAADRDLVARRRGEVDRRQVFVRLTDTGEAILHDLSRHHRDELRSTGPDLLRALTTLLTNALGEAALADGAAAAPAEHDGGNETEGGEGAWTPQSQHRTTGPE
jgi:DNA-binding MarR family transcriptional regulator